MLYVRSDRGRLETLVVVSEHIPFHRLAPWVRNQSSPETDIYYLLNRSGEYGALEHVVFNLVMQRARGSPLCVLDYDPSQAWPWRAETRCPQTIPVSLEPWPSWSDAEKWRLSVLPSGTGWDFYDLEWLLQKWESALGLFDDDILCLSMPVYPMDLYNQRVSPDIVCREMDRYRQERGHDAARRTFYALDLLTRDDLGKRLLGFFYRCRGGETPIQLFEWLWEIYQALPVDHAYRPFLLEKNYAVLDVHRRMTFKPCMLLSQYLSFHGMYVARDFYQRYRQDICEGFVAHRKELHMTTLVPGDGQETWSTERWEAWMDEEFDRLYERVGDTAQWIGRWHLETFLKDSVLWRAVVAVWDYIPRRNIFLWETSSFRYNELQLRIGHHFRVLMDAKTVRAMNRTQKKNFDDIFCKNKKFKSI